MHSITHRMDGLNPTYRFSSNKMLQNPLQKSCGLVVARGWQHGYMIPPPDYPYMKATSPYNTHTTLCLLWTTGNRRNLAQKREVRREQVLLQLKDMHHLYIKCKHYKRWRMEIAERIVEKMKIKLADKGLLETMTSGLLLIVKSMFKNNDIWLLHSSFYYLGLTPQIPWDLTKNGQLDSVLQQQLTYHISHDWHLEAIWLAGRIWGNMQREMARQNEKGGRHWNMGDQ